MRQIQQINNFGSAKIIPYEKDEDLNLDNLDPQNLILGQNGAAFLIKSEWGYVIDPIDFPYSNLKLKELHMDGVEYCSFCPKLDPSIFAQILECFKYIQGKTKEELAINVYYDTETKDFIVNLPKQVISAARVTYEFDETYEYDDRYVPYLQIHSHHSMAASFSSTDDNDESRGLLQFFGVLGKINANSTIYDVDCSFRIWTGKTFVKVTTHDVFDIPEYYCELSEDIIKQLDGIIASSKQAKMKTTKTFPMGNYIPSAQQRASAEEEKEIEEDLITDGEFSLEMLEGMEWYIDDSSHQQALKAQELSDKANKEG